MEEKLLAYLAGCLDCDGSFSIKRDTYAMRVRGDSSVPIFQERVMFAQVREELPILFKQCFGGSYGISKSPSTNGKPVYHWEVRNRQAVTCVKSVLPYLIIKRRQAELILELRKLKEQPRIQSGTFTMKNQWGAISIMPRMIVAPNTIRAKEELFNAIKALNDVRSRQPQLIGKGSSKKTTYLKQAIRRIESTNAQLGE